MADPVTHPWLVERKPCPRCGVGFLLRNLAKHEASCFQPRTLDRLYEIGGVTPGNPDECWEWQGWTEGNGYGAFTSSGVTYRAHREALSLVLDRELAPDEHALHSCDNPPCVNVKHLRAGSQSENMREAVDKGRMQLPQGGTEAAARAARSQDLCRSGRHSRSEVGVYVTPEGWQTCKACKRESVARFNAKKG